MNTDKIYLTSDMHFQHRNIIKYCKRPFGNVDEMDEFILRQFDSLPEDATIIHNGDLFLNSRMEYGKLRDYYLPRMTAGGKRKIWNIMGNHDKTLLEHIRNCPYDNLYDMFVNMGFDRVFMFPILLEGKYLLSHEPVYLGKDAAIYNIYGHTHDKDITPDYFCDDGDRSRMVNIKKYFNICWDKHHRILAWDEVIKKLNQSGKV